MYCFIFLQELREECLDRGVVVDCIQKFLVILEARVYKFGQFWNLREEQLNKNRQLSVEFVQFEKDTREVRSFVVCIVLFEYIMYVKEGLYNLQ